MKRWNIQWSRELKSEKDKLRIMISAAIFLVLLLVFAALAYARYGGGGNRQAARASTSEASASEPATDTQQAGELSAEEAAVAVEPYVASLIEQKFNALSEGYHELAVVGTEGYINLRSAPNELDLSNIIGRLDGGAVVDILEDQSGAADGWYKVSSGQLSGFVSAKLLKTGEEAKKQAKSEMKLRATVTADKLRIRSGPELAEGNTIGAAAQGESYEVLGHEGDWLRVRTELTDTAYGYISAAPQYVRLDYSFPLGRAVNIRLMVLDLYDKLVVSKAQDYINIRKTPKEDGINNIVGKFPGFAGAELLGEENGWYQIQSGEVSGYVKADLVAVGDEARQLAVDHASLMAIVKTEALNVRSEASLDSKAWTQITRNQRYNVLNQLDGWVQIELDTGDDSEDVQGAFISTRDQNVSVSYALQEAVPYFPALEAANRAAAFRNQIVNYACQFVGNPYVWGGTSLTHGADCSGFVQSVLKNFGIYMPRVSRDQAKTGAKVDSSSMKPGDLVFYANRSGTVNHVGMYIGNGQIVNAASRRSGIRIYRWNYRTPVAIRNVIGQ